MEYSQICQPWIPVYKIQNGLESRLISKTKYNYVKTLIVWKLYTDFVDNAPKSEDNIDHICFT